MNYFELQMLAEARQWEMQYEGSNPNGPRTAFSPDGGAPLG